MIQLTALHHVRLGVSDLARARAFAIDFGLIAEKETPTQCWMRTAGVDAYSVVLEVSVGKQLLGVGYRLASEVDLDEAERLTGASTISPLNDAFGGTAVSIRDPDGNVVELVHAIGVRNPDPVRSPLVINDGADKRRRGIPQQKPSLGPPQLLRLGHVGLSTTNMKALDAWYREVLGFLPSDLMHAGPPQNIVAGFYRLNRGSVHVDHHTLALFGMGKPGLHHLSFEVQDPETQHVAHRFMLSKGHNPIWGVGRHELGSHVFDVWRSPDGYRFETFSDTDLLTADAPAAHHPVEKVSLDLWHDNPIDRYFA